MISNLWLTLNIESRFIKFKKSFSLQSDFLKKDNWVILDEVHLDMNTEAACFYTRF